MTQACRDAARFPDTRRGHANVTATPVSLLYPHRSGGAAMFAPPVAMAQTKPAASSTSELAPQRSTLVARPFGASAVEQARMLHRSIGNRATLRRPAQPAASGTGNEPHGHHGQPADQASLNAREATPGIAWD